MLRVHISAEQLRDRLDRDSGTLGPDFKVLRQYDNEQMPAAFVEAQKTVAALQAGGEVNLDDLEHHLDKLLEHSINA